MARTDLARLLERPAADACWRRELEQWEKVIDQDELSPQPIVRAAIRKLRREPPPPAARISVVHGDYRTGNFLYDETGTVRAILDWEMCHLGDPLEDLAWALTPLWGWPDANRPGKLIARDRALALWQEESGVEIDERALAWWELFACVKGIAIWLSSAREFADGKNRDPVMVAAAWYATDIHNRVVVEKLAPTAGGPGVRPTLVDVLGALSARVFGEMLPALPAGYLQSDAMMMALLLAGAAEEHERAAEVRSADVEDFRARFSARAPAPCPRTAPRHGRRRRRSRAGIAQDLGPRRLW